MKRWLLITLLAASTAAMPMQPQKIYRCGPSGRELSQQPCRDAAREPLPPTPGATPDPSRQERADAQDRVKREQALADRLERERLAREKADAKLGARAIGINTRPAPSAPSDAKSPGKRRSCASAASSPTRRSACASGAATSQTRP